MTRNHRIAVAVGAALVCLMSLGASTAGAATPKVSVTYGVAGLQVDATGTVGRGGPQQPSRKRWQVLLQERSASGSWKERASGKLTGRGKRKFSLSWTAPQTQDEAQLRIRVKAKSTIVASTAPEGVELDTSVPPPKLDVVQAGAVVKLPIAADSTLVLDGEHDLTPGQYLSTAPGTGAPDGFLLKVVSSSVGNGQTTVVTEPGSLYDAVPNGSIDMALGDLGNAEPLNASAARLSHAMQRTAGQSTSVPFSKQVSCTAGAQLTYSGELDAALGPHFELNWSKRFGVPTGIDSAQATIDAELSADAEATVSGAASCDLSPITLVAPRWMVIAVIGGVPVPITIEIPIKLRANGSVAGSVHAEAHASADGSVGIRYEDGDVSGIRELNRTASFDVDAEANAHLEGRIGPDIGVSAGWHIPVLGSLAATAGLDVTTGLVLDYDSTEAPPGSLCIPFTAIGDLVFQLPIVGELSTGDITLFDRNIRCDRFPTTTSERARITWNTGADIDLHSFDEEGNEAWYADQLGIPEAFLTTDDVDGFGPEVFYDEQTPSARAFSYALHYYGPGSTEAGPPTRVTVTITDPDGTEHTSSYVLNVDDYVSLGSSKAGPAAHPPPSFALK
jgi:hypothetical protein